MSYLYSSLFVPNYLLLYDSCLVPDCLFFCRLKTSHDSHELILEFSTAVNTSSVQIDTYSIRQKKRAFF